jgi:hypothetical protein
MDCALLVRMSALPPAVSLRELRERVASCEEGVLQHHFCDTPLRHTFDNPDYRNDFAVWAKLYLGDRVLSERLGIIDPYSFDCASDLRAHLVDLLDERLGEVSSFAPVPPGDEFYFKESTTIVFDTGIDVPTPEEIPGAVRRMTPGSVFYHFLEARRRPPEGVDDFSAWLSKRGERYAPFVAALGGIDVYFLGLGGLREALLDALAPLEERP